MSNVVLDRDSQVHMETQKPLNSQTNPKQKEQCGKHHNTWPQIVVQHHSDSDSMTQAQKHSTKGMRLE